MHYTCSNYAHAQAVDTTPFWEERRGHCSLFIIDYNYNCIMLISSNSITLAIRSARMMNYVLTYNIIIKKIIYHACIYRSDHVASINTINVANSFLSSFFKGAMKLKCCHSTSIEKILCFCLLSFFPTLAKNHGL